MRIAETQFRIRPPGHFVAKHERADAGHVRLEGEDQQIQHQFGVNRIRIGYRHRFLHVGQFLHGLLLRDLDLLVEPTLQTTLFDIGAIRFELKELLGLNVDVLTPNGLPAKFREQVLREAVPV